MQVSRVKSSGRATFRAVLYLRTPVEDILEEYLVVQQR
jgi:hypothetical protein